MAALPEAMEDHGEIQIASAMIDMKTREERVASPEASQGSAEINRAVGEVPQGAVKFHGASTLPCLDLSEPRQNLPEVERAWRSTAGGMHPMRDEGTTWMPHLSRIETGGWPIWLSG